MPCGCMGCSGDLYAYIDHPELGQRAVCKEHVDGYPILEEVGA